MKESTSNFSYFYRYCNRLKKYRRKYFFERLDELRWNERYSVTKLFKWIKEDAGFTLSWTLSILLQIRAYGSSIRREYGQSYWSQIKRLMYVRFVLRKSHRHFRTRLLFKSNSWKQVNDFVLDHFLAQKELIQLSSASEFDIINNKFKFYQYCISKEIPTPAIFAVIEKGGITFQEFKQLIPEASFFIKNLADGKGKRTRKFEFIEGNFFDSRKEIHSFESLKKSLTAMSVSEGSIVIQPLLKNHSSWIKYTSGSLATCRIVTARTPENGNIIPLFCCLRMPVGDSDADNYSLGGIITPIDVKTGRMGVGVTLKPIDGKFEFTRHPGTHHQFDGEILPQWQELLNFTLDVHSHFQTIFVGWDVSYTSDGCSLIEGNVGWASGSYEIPFQDSLKNTAYPELFEKWMEKYESRA